jgi:hypothetical protein
VVDFDSVICDTRIRGELMNAGELRRDVVPEAGGGADAGRLLAGDGDELRVVLPLEPAGVPSPQGLSERLYHQHLVHCFGGRVLLSSQRRLLSC